MRPGTVLWIFLFLASSAQAQAQSVGLIEIPSSFNPVGSGARALGMGGAFIAVADDATAASWNPGGLTQLERPEVSVVGAYLHRAEKNGFGTAHEADGTERVEQTRLNYLSVTYPFSARGRNMVLSANYQALFDLSRDWKFRLSGSLDDRTIRYVQRGEIGALGAGYCLELTPDLSAGVALNFWGFPRGLQTWEERTHVRNDARTLSGEEFSTDTATDERFRLEGLNLNAGILWRLTEQLTGGLVVKTPFTADVRHTFRVRRTVHVPGDPGRDTEVVETFRTEEELDMPLSYGLGFAYRFSDTLTVSADVYRTEWQDFILVDEQGNRRVPTTGVPADESAIDPTHQLRAGVEYLLVNPGHVIPLRAGLFYDPVPADHSPDDYYGVSLGAGSVHRGWALDVAYQYRWGNGVGRSLLRTFSFSQDVSEHTIYSSVIVYF